MAEGLSLGGVYVSIGGEMSQFSRMLENVENSMKQTVSKMDGIGTQIKERATLAWYALGYAVEDAGKKLETMNQRFMLLGQPLQTMGFMMTAAGAAMTGSLTAAAHSAGKVGDEFKNMSQRMGVSIETLTKMEYAATLSGASLGELEIGMRFLQRSIAEASSGSETARKKFEMLKIPLASLQGIGADKQFMLVADAISKIEDPAKRTQMAMEVFSRGGTKLMPMLREGSEGMKRMYQEAVNLGLVLSTEDAEAAEEFDDKMGVMQLGLSRMSFYLGQQVMPLLTMFADWVLEHVKVVKQWAEANRNLVRTIFYVGSAITALGTIVLTAGGFFMFFASAVGTASTALTLADMTMKGLMTSTLKWSGTVLVIAASISILSDVLLQMFGVANLGIVDMLTSFRISGVKISTWMESTWLQIFKGWEWLKYGVLVGLEAIWFAAYKVGGNISQALIKVFLSIADSFWAMVKNVASGWDYLNGMFGRETKAGAAVDKMQADSRKAVETLASQAEVKGLKGFDATAKELAKERDKQISAYNAGIGGAFKRDSEEAVMESSAGKGGDGTGKPTTEFGRVTDSGQFKQMNLNRFTLPTAGISSAKGSGFEQKVQAPGLESLAAEQVRLLKQLVGKQPVATLK